MKSKILPVLLLALALHAWAAPRTSLVTVTAPAKFEQRDKDHYLVITDAQNSFDIFWSLHAGPKDFDLFPCTLKDKETYTFTIEVEPRKIDRPFELSKNAIKEDEYIKIPTLIRIVHNDTLIYDREICEAHHRKMERREVPIIYGMPAAPEGKPPTEKQCRTQFPHFAEKCWGGCCIDEFSKKTDFIYICPDCVAAHQEWEKDRPAK